MQLKSIVHKIYNEPAYFFGRFYTLRKLYSRISSGSLKNIEQESNKSDLVKIENPNALQDLDENAIALGIKLSESAAKELYEFGKSSRLKKWAWTEGKTFQYEDVQDGKINGEPVAIAEVWDKEDCELVYKIAEDPEVLNLVRSYLGYHDVQFYPRFFWTFAGEMSDEMRIKSNQTIEYHFDVHSWNFCYLHFYLTDTDENSGAHQMVKGSHKKKPLKWLWGSAKKSDEAIVKQYGKDKILTIVGKAGDGFLEDTSCYHKGLAPENQNRLLLQIRYF